MWKCTYKTTSLTRELVGVIRFTSRPLYSSCTHWTGSCTSSESGWTKWRRGSLPRTSTRIPAHSAIFPVASPYTDRAIPPSLLSHFCREGMQLMSSQYFEMSICISRLIRDDNWRVVSSGMLWYRCSQFTVSCHPDERGANFLRSVGSYKSHTV
jgi:hypothetical protein